MPGSEKNNQNNSAADALDPTADIPYRLRGQGNIIGHFHIERELGRGGMGVVYLAHDTRLDRLVAIKSLPQELMADPKVGLRLKHEAKLLASLNHPNIATIYEEFEGAEHVTYLVLEYVPGQTLAEHIKTSRLTLHETLTIAYQIAAALAAAHEHGVIHRDLKPGNIKIRPDGTVKVLDFGLAKLMEDETQSLQSTVTQPGRLIGTPAYMSPEQAEGGPVDWRTDIWSLGVVIHEMLTGELPFKSNTQHAMIHSILCDAPERLSRVRSDAPVGLEQLLLKMMQKDRLGRPENMKAVTEELESIKRHLTTSLTSSKRSLSIAVLPFEDMSPHKDQEYFCDGMAEELINALTQIRNLRVIARTSAFFYKGKHVNVRDIGRELNVETLLEGSVRKAGNRLRITAQLIDAAGGHHLWSERYDRDLDNVFAIQDEITLAIVDKLKPRLLSDTKVQVAKRQSVEFDVYDLYLKGLYFRTKGTEETVHRAIECFEQAIEKDSTYALAYAGLAVAYGFLPIYCHSPSTEVIPKATNMALRAIEIDETLSEAYAALGFIKTWYDWDWTGAEKSFQRAIELNPGLSMSHNWYSFNLLFKGRIDEAVEEMEKALQLDPLSVAINRNFSMVCFCARQYDRSLDASRRTLELDPSSMFAHLHRGEAYVGKSMYEEALAEFQNEMEVSKGSHGWAETLSAYVYIQMGNPAKAKEEQDNLLERSKRQYVSPFVVACSHFVLGQYDEGFKWANKAYEECDPWLHYLKILPMLESIRLDPRYIDLLKKVNLDR